MLFNPLLIAFDSALLKLVKYIPKSIWHLYEPLVYKSMHRDMTRLDLLEPYSE